MCGSVIALIQTSESSILDHLLTLGFLKLVGPPCMVSTVETPIESFIHSVYIGSSLGTHTVLGKGNTIKESDMVIALLGLRPYN
jgi:hypothetical protein